MAKQPSFRTILRPDFPTASQRAKHNLPGPMMEDYILVPRLATFGTWSVLDLLDPEKAALLATFANILEDTAKRRDPKGVAVRMGKSPSSHLRPKASV